MKDLIWRKILRHQCFKPQVWVYCWKGQAHIKHLVWRYLEQSEWQVRDGADVLAHSPVAQQSVCWGNHDRIPPQGNAWRKMHSDHLFNRLSPTSKPKDTLHLMGDADIISCFLAKVASGCCDIPEHLISQKWACQLFKATAHLQHAAC